MNFKQSRVTNAWTRKKSGIIQSIITIIGTGYRAFKNTLDKAHYLNTTGNIHDII